MRKFGPITSVTRDIQKEMQGLVLPLKRALHVTHFILRLSHFILIFGPLAAMPLMLTVRWDALVAPNEEPKWVVLVVLGVVLMLAGLVQGFLRCPPRPPAAAERPCLSVPGIWLLVFFIGLAIGVGYTVNPGEGLNRLAFWCAGGLTLAAVAWAARHTPGDRYIGRISWAVSISAAWLSVLFWWGYFVDFPRSDFNKFVQFSPIGHFNFTADVLMVIIPLLAWITLTGSPWLRWLALPSLATSAFMLLISGSLGGMGGLSAGALVAAILALARRISVGSPGQWRPSRRTVLTVLTLTGLLALAAKPAFEHLPKEYREQMFVRGEWWEAPEAGDLAKARSLPPLAPLWMGLLPYLGSRTPMWAATAGMVADRPWIGWGTGSYLFEYPGYSKRYDLFGDFETLGTRIKTNPHNVLLQIAAENGIPMALLFAGLYGWLMTHVMRRAWHDPTAFWLCGVWALWAMGLDAMVNHVFFNPASLFMAAMGLGLWAGRLPLPAGTRSVPLCPMFRWPAIPVAMLALGLWLASFPLRWVASEYYVAKAMRMSETTPTPPARDLLVTWVNARVWFPTNVQALYGLAAATLKLEQPQSAEAYLKAFLKLAPNHSAALNMLATIQANTQRYEEAEKTLERALTLEPDAQTLQENLQNLWEHLRNPSPPPPVAPPPVAPQSPGG